MITTGRFFLLEGKPAFLSHTQPPTPAPGAEPALQKNVASPEDRRGIQPEPAALAAGAEMISVEFACSDQHLVDQGYVVQLDTLQENGRRFVGELARSVSNTTARAGVFEMWFDVESGRIGGWRRACLSTVRSSAMGGRNLSSGRLGRR